MNDSKHKEQEQTTSELYGSLFTAYDQKRFDESVELFNMRHTRWGIPLEWFHGKTCLDAGCGGGRFVVALAKLGAERVEGVDISEEAITAAQERIKERGLEHRAHVRVGSVLDVPFPDQSFEYVVCSGVVHHTPDPKKGFNELVRVLKPGGKFFFSVYGKGGLVWMINDIGRLIAKVIPFKIMEGLWKVIGIPPNKRYNYLDNMYVPYCYRFTEKEIRTWLEDAGFENIRRVKFERYDYETLKSHFFHGEGWLQFYADKKANS